MVNSIKNIVNRVEVQKGRDLDSKVGSSTPDSAKVAPAARDTVKVSEAASPNSCPSFRLIHQSIVKLSAGLRTRLPRVNIQSMLISFRCSDGCLQRSENLIRETV